MRIAIIGAGAAGCFAAANIQANEHVEITVFEKTGKALQKVKASGGGRCNVTHACFDIPELLTRYPRGKQLLRKTLYPFGPAQTIEWFAERGVQLKEEADGRMFPVTDNSQTVMDCLWQEMMHEKVKVSYHKSVVAIRNQDGGSFMLSFADDTSYEADIVIIACGGYPKPEQYKWLQLLGHSIQPPVPSLFTFNIPGHAITQLMGVSVPDVCVKISGTKTAERGPILITHWGLSGPVILRTSAWAARELHERNYRFDITVNWLGDKNDSDLKETFMWMRKELGSQFVQNKNPFDLPKRLWEYLLTKSRINSEMRWGDLPASLQNKLTEHLVRDTYSINGKTTFKEEFVTAGGINISEIDPQTMQSRLVSNLYFAGEIIDVDGITGGYNFQHAWASAMAVARHINQYD
ncbi:MAG: NAD(P)/FAD-dependent oxidoreductase [Taibaiella sp.]|nr:NAD(P)/FAD-dependent oxidoreductase [Taibaiella sp.]